MLDLVLIKQKENSIDAQLRACKEFAENKRLEIVNTFIDRAKSGTTIKREKHTKVCFPVQ